MSTMAMEIDPAQQRELERFYFYEARLLDNREFMRWLGLLTEDVRYVMPSRVNAQVDNRERGKESMIGLEQELERDHAMGCPLREESYVLLMVRAERAYKINSWAEHPPARTRRLVGNIELMEREGDTSRVVSNFHMHYARPGSATVMYSGQRRDFLKSTPEGFRISRREIVLDYSDIEFPTVGLFF